MIYHQRRISVEIAPPTNTPLRLVLIVKPVTPKPQIYRKLMIYHQRRVSVEIAPPTNTPLRLVLIVKPVMPKPQIY